MPEKNGVVKVYDEYSPLLYKFNYMLYAAVLGAVIMYAYVVGQGGVMPPPGSFYEFMAQCWKWFTGPIILPLILAAVNHWRGKNKMKRRSSDK